MFFDIPIRCSATNSTRAKNPMNGESYTTAREIWTRAPRAAARKATAEGVNGIAIDESGGGFFIIQISGYTPERGLYCDMLDESGRVVASY